MLELAACAADRPDGGFVALVLVGHTSHHSLVEFKDVSKGDSCWERSLLISRKKMKEGSATELSQPLLFDADQPPSLGQQCIFRGKVSPADVLLWIEVDILQYTNECRLQREARIRASNEKK